MEERYKRILVTGGAGFIGSYLVEAALRRGFEVRILDNLSSGRLENLSAMVWEGFYGWGAQAMV